MRNLVRETVKAAAQKAGLDPARVYDLVESDNLTIKRPYMTLQFLPETFARTGRKLAVLRNAGDFARKRELYLAELAVAANVLAEDEQWLADFCHDFLVALPAGVNDSRQNWVKIRAQKAQFSKPADKRIGARVIEVFKKRDQLFEIAFTGRITAQEREQLITEMTISGHWQGNSDSFNFKIKRQ